MSEDTENIQDGYWEALLKREQEEINVELDLKIIAKHLEYAREHGLEAEVIWSAVKHAKANPKAGMLEIMHVGCEEWDVSS